MAEALAKIKDNRLHPATTGDTDGSLLTPLLEALTGGAQLNVGQKGRTTHSPVNYSKGGDASDIVDNHLAGIDTAFGGKASSTHKDTHKSGGGDAFTSSDLLEAVIKRLQVTGPVTLTVGACADGKFLKRSGSTLVGDDPPGMSAHAIGGSYHTEDSLANLNSKITDGNLDLTTASRTPTQHGLGSSTYHSTTTLANLNGRVSDATLVHTAYSLSGDVTGSPAATVVAKVKGYSFEGGAPLAKEVMQYSGSQWQYNKGVKPWYDSGWFAVVYNQTYSKPHGLGAIPHHVEVYWASSGSPSTIYRVPAYTSSGESAGRGCIVELNSTYVIVRTGSGSGAGTFDTYGFGGTRVYSASGYYKIVAWGPALT